MKKKLLLLAASVPVTAIGGLYSYVFKRSQPALFKALLDKKSHAEDYYVRRDTARDRLNATMHLRYSIQSDRGETLQGFYFPCGRVRSKKLAFIVHGYRSEHAETAGMLLELYLKRGFDVFTCDNTASGESGGDTIGFDVFESADCLKWIEFLREELGEDIQIVLHGFSLGGATVLKMSDRCPDLVKFIVSDSGFIDAGEMLKPSLGVLFPLMQRLYRLDSGIELADTNVSENVKNSKLPILIVHGTDDPTVPFSMAPRIFELIQSDRDFLYTEGARHIETSHYAREAYEAKLDAFIEKYIS